MLGDDVQREGLDTRIQVVADSRFEARVLRHRHRNDTVNHVEDALGVVMAPVVTFGANGTCPLRIRSHASA